MSTFTWLLTVWALITIAFGILLLYRSRLTKQESDWIPLTDDEREEKAIQMQTIIEMKTQKLSLPIRALGVASVVMLLAMLGFWLYQGITSAPPTP